MNLGMDEWNYSNCYKLIAASICDASGFFSRPQCASVTLQTPLQNIHLPYHLTMEGEPGNPVPKFSFVDVGEPDPIDVEFVILPPPVLMDNEFLEFIKYKSFYKLRNIF